MGVIFSALLGVLTAAAMLGGPIFYALYLRDHRPERYNGAWRTLGERGPRRGWVIIYFVTLFVGTFVYHLLFQYLRNKGE